MNIVSDRTTLADAINIVLKAVPNRTTLPILECILVIADKKGVRLLANDLDLGIETNSIDADIFEEGNVALEAKVFSDIIRRLPKGSVTIKTDENNITTIKCQKSEFKILGQSGEEFPFLPEIEKTNIYGIHSNILKNMIRQTIFSVALDDTKPVMTGELIAIKDKTIKLVAVDGFRISLRNALLAEEKEEDDNEEKIDNIINFTANQEIKAVIPGKALNEVSKILTSDEDEIVGISITEKHVLFELSNCIVVSRLLEGDFINYENIFTSDYTTMLKVDRELFLDSIERASLLGKESKKSPVKLNIASNKMIITSFTEMGNSYDEINIVLDGLPLEIAFNPRYLIDVLKAIDEDEICVQFTTPLSPCIIKHETIDSYQYLVLPLRLKN